ncbi:hydrolase [Acinetobacter sp. ACNIH2]|uniref:HAD family hydrolase n=1 Tax=Acinetobacter sp. ACNIH2 TaxID=1758189 RepID=UPI000CDC28AA|nr:HAD family hydrolase [Acinetobacter sp. ACNIH2]AUX84712.1 hydrolase [Acinetobacter sp. ACNIH2]
MNQTPKVIIFDAFGTLVKIGESRHPYRRLMNWLKDNGRKPTTNDASIIMSNNLDFEELAVLFGKALPTELLKEINHDLQFELNTIMLFEDVIPTLQILKDLGFKIALCSNLAKPYGDKLKTILPKNLFDVLVLSYEVDAIKPEINIYETLRTKLDFQMCEALFIGDNPILDVEVPISLGMSARLIERNKMQNLSDVLSDLLLKQE